jgi:hypothetical protein
VGGSGFGTRVFWTAAIPDGDVQVHLGAGTAELNVSNLALYDYPNLQIATGSNWQTALVPATVSFDVVWSGPVTRRVSITNGTSGDQFAGHYVENQATVTWSASNANGFTFTANPGNFSTSVPEDPKVNGVSAPLNFFAEVGQERNGVFFPAGNGEHGSDGLDRSATATMPATGDASPATTAGLAGSKNAPAGQTAANAAALVPALGGSMAAVTVSLPTFLSSPRRDDGPPSTPVSNAQPVQPTSPWEGLAPGAAHDHAVDQVFAGLDGSTFSDTRLGDGFPAWAAYGRQG